MNNNIELLIRLIIPALFLVAWALNQALNKEAPPPPPARGPLPDPFRNRLPPAQRPPGTLIERLERTAPPPRPATPSLRPGQEIVIVESETRSLRPQAGPASQAQQQQSQRNPRRNNNRQPRRNQGAGPLTPERGKADQRDRPRTGGAPNLTPGLTDAPVGAPGGISATASAAEDHEPRQLTPNPALDLLRTALADPDQVRRAILVNEIFQPPVVLRGRRQLTGRR
jgi:hypothetical protein